MQVSYCNENTVIRRVFGRELHSGSGEIVHQREAATSLLETGVSTAANNVAEVVL